MMEEALFKTEEKIIRRAEEMLKGGFRETAHPDREFEQLLESYKKMYKQLRRLIRINDKQAKKLNEANELLTRLSTVDDLTGVNNRRFFDERFVMEWQRACRRQSTLSLILADIDFFKQINDNHGHQAGDACLKTIARNLKELFRRSTDVVARYGGEEFCVLLPDQPRNEVEVMADSLRRMVADLEICHENLRIKTTISIGVATRTPDSPDGWSRMLHITDSALYRAKQTGRNRVCVA
ncbi:MAG: GGDEF domain-containing protein [Thermodesulfobacteriota bacterium]